MKMKSITLLISQNLTHASSLPQICTTLSHPQRLNPLNTNKPHSIKNITSHFQFLVIQHQQSTNNSIKPLNFQATKSFTTMSSGGDGGGVIDDEKIIPKEEVIVQYVVLRRDLIDTWPVGSVVAQGCHASVAAVWESKDDPVTISYCSPANIDSMHKVTLEVKGETQLVKLSEKLKSGGVTHKVWIEQPENYPTCLATKPYPKSFVSPFLKNLKLCK